MKRLKLLLSTGALASVLVCVGLMLLTNGPLFRIGGFTIGLYSHGPEIVFHVPSRPGDPYVVVPQYALFVLVPLPVLWLTAYSLAIAAMMKRFAVVAKRTWHMLPPPLILVAAFVVWLPLVITIHGPNDVGERLEIAIQLFLFFCILAVPVVLLSWWARWIVDLPNRKIRNRVARNQCAHCGYSLVGNVSGVCPECGEHAILTDAKQVKSLLELTESPDGSGT